MPYLLDKIFADLALFSDDCEGIVVLSMSYPLLLDSAAYVVALRSRILRPK